ncbi:MAG: hypothetical protein EZS28_018455, partial [Streblomastix strix]
MMMKIFLLTVASNDRGGSVQDLMLLCQGMHQIVNFGQW